LKKFWKVAASILFVMLLAGSYPAYRLIWGKPFTINQLANRQGLEFLIANPEIFTAVGIADGTVFDRHSGKLAAVGLDKRDADYRTYERFIGEVKQFDRSQLDRQDRITYDILLDQYETSLAFKRFGWLSSQGLYPINPMFGTQVELPSFMLSMHVVKNEKTATNYVARLEAMGDKLDAVTAEAQRQAREGLVLPISLLDKSLLVIADTVRPSPEQSPLVSTFVERMDKVQDLDAELKGRLRVAAIAAVRNRVYPAYARMTAALEAMRPAAATQSAGVDRLPDGAAYYRLMLRQMTSTDEAPEKLHALGLAEIARITAEMDTELKAQGMATGSVAARMTALAKDPRFLLPNTDAGRAQMLTRYQEILDAVAARMPQYFRNVPPTRLIVKRVPQSAEKGSALAYYEPAAMDGSRPGSFYANLHDLDEVPTWGMKTVSYHEGIPGHHFQIATAQGLSGLPLIRQQPIYTAYAEGWALYAERLAAEIGMYKDDPWGDLGRLQAELFRAVRLVVDTGIHAEGWSREKAIDYLVSTTGLTQGEATTEVERYMSLPGQACAYKVGQMKILELRERAKVALGPRFNLKDFHAVVLENGAVPLTLLERLIDEWIASESARR
jgi:uncharacterized protein (DUF885 family)